MSPLRVAAAAGAVGMLGVASWRLRTGRPARAALGLLGVVAVWTVKRRRAASEARAP